MRSGRMRTSSTVKVSCSTKSVCSTIPASSTTWRSWTSPQCPRTCGCRSAFTRRPVSPWSVESPVPRARSCSASVAEVDARSFSTSIIRASTALSVSAIGRTISEIDCSRCLRSPVARSWNFSSVEVARVTTDSVFACSASAAVDLKTSRSCCSARSSSVCLSLAASRRASAAAARAATAAVASATLRPSCCRTKSQVRKPPAANAISSSSSCTRAICTGLRDRMGRGNFSAAVLSCGLDRLDPPKRREPRRRAQPDLSGGYEPAFSDVTLIVFTPSFSVTSPVASTFFATKSRSLAFLSFV